MGLKLPRAITINNFNGGYVTDKTFATLADNETSDAQDIEITKEGGIRKRFGYRRMLSNALITLNGSATLQTSSTTTFIDRYRS